LQARLSELFSTPGRQAAGWALLGVVGLFLALGGALLIFSGGDDDGVQPASGRPTATATASGTGVSGTPGASPSASPSATASASPPPTGSPSPSPTATQTPVSQQPGSSTGGGSDPAPTPTPPPVAAGGPYCDNSSSTAPPTARVAGSLRISGTGAPLGTVVYLAFDGVLGPSKTTTKAGEYNVDFWTGGETCANRVGAAISVVVNGQSFASGHTIGDGAYLIPVLIDVP